MDLGKLIDGIQEYMDNQDDLVMDSSIADLLHNMIIDYRYEVMNG